MAPSSHPCFWGTTWRAATFTKWQENHRSCRKPVPEMGGRPSGEGGAAGPGRLGGGTVLEGVAGVLSISFPGRVQKLIFHTRNLSRNRWAAAARKKDYKNSRLIRWQKQRADLTRHPKCSFTTSPTPKKCSFTASPLPKNAHSQPPRSPKTVLSQPPRSSKNVLSQRPRSPKCSFTASPPQKMLFHSLPAPKNAFSQPPRSPKTAL